MYPHRPFTAIRLGIPQDQTIEASYPCALYKTVKSNVRGSLYVATSVLAFNAATVAITVRYRDIVDVQRSRTYKNKPLLTVRYNDGSGRKGGAGMELTGMSVDTLDEVARLLSDKRRQEQV